MKALSVKQPWAYLIIHGGKDIENRSWQTSYRGPLLIHAGQRPDREALAYFAGFLPDELHCGVLIGVVELVEIVTESRNPWFTGPFGWRLVRPRPVEPEPVTGALNLFDVPNELIRSPRPRGPSPSPVPLLGRRIQSRPST